MANLLKDSELCATCKHAEYLHDTHWRCTFDMGCNTRCDCLRFVEDVALPSTPARIAMVRRAIGKGVGGSNGPQRKLIRLLIDANLLSVPRNGASYATNEGHAWLKKHKNGVRHGP